MQRYGGAVRRLQN